MKNTLNNKIFKMLAALVLVTTIILLAVVWNSTSKSITESLTDRLRLAESVVVREINSRQQMLIKNSQLLVDDYMLKRVIESGNKNQIKQALESYRSKLNATFVSIRGTDGRNIESSGRMYDKLDQGKMLDLMRFAETNGDSSDTIAIDETLIWLLYLPIDNTRGVATSFAVLGFAIGEDFLQSLKDIVALDISMLVQTEKTFIVSSLPLKKQRIYDIENSVMNQNKSSWLYLSPVFSDYTLFSRKFNLSNPYNFNSEIYVSADASKLKSSFLQLQLTIAAIAVVALIFAIIVGRIISNQITRPLEYIANYASNISKGNYNESIDLKACSLELDQLLNAFKSMEFGVKQRESEIQYQAQHDMLTKLYNRNYFTEFLQASFASNNCFQVIGINISGFRTINDVFGYEYGDACVRELANRVKQHGGTSARTSGGEILWSPKEPLRFEEIEKFKAKLDQSIHIEKIHLPIITSIGILNCPTDTNSAEDLYRRMNIVIDEAQLTNSLVAEFSHDFEDCYLRRLAIIDNLKTALSTNSRDLSLSYQPKIDLETLCVADAEALIRWNDKELGFVPPDEFILIAEQAGLINQVTTWVLEQVACDIVNFKKQGVDICIAVNISAQDLLDEEFTNRTRSLLAKHSLSNADISFELTESVIVQEPEKSILQMQVLRDEGFSLAIDDFGTGYSSLSYITRLPVDTIKIDKCFVMPLATNEGEQSICKAVLKLASNFNMRVVAEGVEDGVAMNMLKAWGCKYAQGYHISRPLPAQELVAWVKNRHQTTPAIA
jgi:diguanylate cyclase (GGDEF)-like protein